MFRLFAGASALALAAGAAQAGGVERTILPIGILFEEGQYAEFSFSFVDPDLSGTVGGGAVSSGDMAPGYTSFSFAYKQELNDQMDLALIVDQPIGANVDYPLSGAPYPAAGSTATLSSLGVTALLRYEFQPNMSVYGGLRALSTEGEVELTALGYTLDTSRELDLGWVAGVAYERPDIALRVALTYTSPIVHDLGSIENGTDTGGFRTEVPQSLTLDFQTGVAADTLVFGSVRWVEWTAFEIAPVGYQLATGTALVDYESDRVTWNLGVGRRFTEQWSGALTVGYEHPDGELTGNLAPTDGFTSIGLAATYTMDNIEITGGIRYVWLGDATTIPPISGEFQDNSAIGVGVRIGYAF